MGKLRSNQAGFGLVGIVSIACVVILLGAAGYVVYRHHKRTPAKSATTTNPIKATSPSAQRYLIIKEWGVKIALTAPIKDATYQIVTNNKYLKPSAFLSTAALDASTDCTSYYAKGASADNPQPTFQYIERFALTDTTSFDEGVTTLTAEQAAQQRPSVYKQIGHYVYYFGHGNGMACKEQTTDQTSAFAAAFGTIVRN